MPLESASAASLDLPLIAKHLLAAKGDHVLAHTLAANARAPARVLSILSRAAAGAVTTDSASGQALVDIAVAQSAFFTSLRTRSIFFRMLDSGFRRVPLRTRLGIVSASATGWLVGESEPKPLSTLTLSNPALMPQKAAALLVVSDEVARDTSSAGQSLITQELRGAVSDVVDESFFDAVMVGAPSTASVGMIDDLKTLLDQVNVSGSGALFWCMSVDVGNRLSLILDDHGDMSPQGGEFVGLPALVSGTIPAGTLRLVNASSIAANADAISLDASNQVDIHMRDDPETEAQLTSMWQTGSVCLKCEVDFAAEKTRADAVAEVTDIEWPSLASG